MALDRRTTAIAVLVVLAAGAIGVAAGAVVTYGGDDVTPVAVGGAPDPSTEPPVTASAPGTVTPTPGPLPGVTVPVYVLGDTRTGPRLYREFRQVAGSPSADEVELAVQELAMKPADPDYRTPWAGVAVVSVTRSGTDATVTFGSAPALRKDEAALAVQQVVHTVTATDHEVARVRVVAPGLPAAMTATARPRASQADVLAPVWLVDPAQGARSGSKVVLSGTASVFEAAVSIEVRDGARVAARATATASVGAPERGEWTATVTLPPGTYTVVAYEVSAKDGSREFEDSKVVTVT